jgi:hypothetical protein
VKCVSSKEINIYVNKCYEGLFEGGGIYTIRKWRNVIVG